MKPVRVISGPVAALDRTSVDTDQIIPKQFLKRIERSGFGEFLFYDWMKQADFPLMSARVPRRPILVTGRNFGCGSSREHAPGRCRTSATRRSWPRASATSSPSTARKIGLLTVVLARRPCAS